MLNKPDIAHIIEQEGIVIKRGKALCPFHSEKNPSFTVSTKMQTFHCFGCGVSGDVITFIMKLKGITFKEALVYLGIESGRPVKPNPGIQREKKIQEAYETEAYNLYDSLCQQSRELHKIRMVVKANPRALTEKGVYYYAGLMSKLAEIDFKLDTLIWGNFEDIISLLREERNVLYRNIK